MKNKKLIFYSLIDFFPKKETIKEEYDILSLDDKMIYKMYVYSLPWMDDSIKDLIWEYLNDSKEVIFDLSKEYRKKKAKLDKRKRANKNIEEDDEWVMW